MDEVQLEPVDYPSRWYIVRANVRRRWWQFQHWFVTHVFDLRFCPSCAGYFPDECMTLPDKCEACYARDYGVDRSYNPADTSPYSDE